MKLPLPVYARKTDSGVAIFRDPDASNLFCHFQRRNHAIVPDRRFKYVTLNCYRWRLVWLPA